MATAVVTVSLLLAILPQAIGLPSGPMPDALSALEKTRLTAAPNIEKRIKIYTDASDERRRSVEKAVAEQNFEAIALILRAWKEVLDFSLSDIQANAGQRSKSRALKNYEIQLRKSLGAMNSLKTKGSYEQIEAFESWLEHAGEVQGKLVAILFPS